MATTTITVASFQDACAECGDAITSEAWAAAAKFYALAEAINAGLEKASSSSEDRYERREDLEGLGKALKFAQIAVAGSDRRRLISTTTRFS